MDSTHHYSHYMTEEGNKRVNQWLDASDTSVNPQDLEEEEMGGCLTLNPPIVQQQAAQGGSKGHRLQNEELPPIPATNLRQRLKDKLPVEYENAKLKFKKGRKIGMDRLNWHRRGEDAKDIQEREAPRVFTTS